MIPPVILNAFTEDILRRAFCADQLHLGEVRI